MQEAKLLIIEDDHDLRESVAVYLRDGGFTVLESDNGRAGLAAFYQHAPDVVLTDLRMPVMDGFAVIRDIAENNPDTPVLVISGTAEINDAIKAMRLGARDYIVKPIHAMEELELNIRRALQESSLRNELSSLKNQILSGTLKHPQAFSAIITRHPSMLSIFQYLEAIAATSQPILITGETGTGKELFARAIHTLSGRKGQLVTVNVAGLDDTMFCDALFGHVKGAFTGADHLREGLISRAGGGTLFLDEIGDLKESSQIKLLRLIQEGEYYPNGSDTVRKTDCRIIAATHRDLNAMVELGSFRQDLYYRLYAHMVKIPRLAERKDDIQLLLEHFLMEASQELKKRKPKTPPELLSYLSAYAFPGNVRELRGMVYDAVARHSSGVLSMDSFLAVIGNQRQSYQTAGPDAVIVLRDSRGERMPTLREAESLLIAQAMNTANGNQGVAASCLGINRSALNKKLSKKRKTVKS